MAAEDQDENIIPAIRDDVAAFKALVGAGLTITDSVLNGLWRWFRDVELIMPLGVMGMSRDERTKLSLLILEEMDEQFAVLERIWEQGSEEVRDGIGELPEAAKVNALWRELAGVYAELINAEMRVLPAEMRAAIEAEGLSALAENFHMDEESLRSHVKSDPALRMMIRMNGLDPDRLS